MYSFTRCISSIIADRAALWKAERFSISNESENCIREHRSGNSEAGNGESYSELQLDSGNVIDVDQNRGSAAVGVDRKHAVAKEGVAVNDTDYYCRGPCLLSQTEIHRISGSLAWTEEPADELGGSMAL